MSARHDRPIAGTSSLAGVSGVALLERLGAVLADLRFPARRWQVLTVGDLYGVDTATRGLLELLPERRYHSMAEVAGVLAAVLAGGAHPARRLTRGQVSSRSKASSPTQTRSPSPSSLMAPSSSSESSRAAPRACSL